MTRATTPAGAEVEALRIVFFGTPRSGKTKLLEAFERIASADAETVPLVVKADVHGALAPREVVSKIVLVDLPDSNLVARSALLLDCDGEAAGRLFGHPDALHRSRGKSELVDAIRAADALVLIVEARSTEGEIEAQFGAFEQFLRSLREGRTFGREVGGWPIFLTLTMSDKLCETGMEAHEWLERVEREKNRLRDQFVARFDEVVEAPGEFYSFGSLRLSTEATATQLPEDLKDNAYDTQGGTLNLDTYVPGVLEAAGEYHHRRVTARRRLNWTATGVVALFGAMLLLVLGLFTAAEPSPLERLAARVQALQSQREPAASRLAEKNLASRRAELEKIRDSRGFSELPAESQTFVLERLREIDAYRDYAHEFAPPQFAPADVRTLGMFQRLRTELDSKLAPPGEYAPEWADTEAVRLREKWRDDLRLLSEYEDRVHNWYRRLIAEATELAVQPQQGGWRSQIGRLIADAEAFPFVPPGNPASLPMYPVPGSRTLTVARGEALTFGDVLRYERADFAKRDWELAERRLLDLRDLCDAVGLTIDPESHGSDPLLRLPEPNGKRAESMALGGNLMEILVKIIPRAAAGTAYWQTATFPDPLRQELSRRLTLAAETGRRHVRFLIESELKRDGRPDTPADWQKLVAAPSGLLLLPDLQSWGRLLQLLHSWSDAGRGEADPVAGLAEFLKRDKHALPLSAVEIYLPHSLRVQVLEPAGALQLTVTPETGAPRVLSLKVSADVKSDANGSTYRFVPDVPLTPLDYRPGERFDAELPLKAGANRYVLRWNRSRTDSFAFEKLLLDPDLERVQPAEKPQRAPGVRVKILPEKAGGLVPELLPAVRGIN